MQEDRCLFYPFVENTRDGCAKAGGHTRASLSCHWIGALSETPNQDKFTGSSQTGLSPSGCFHSISNTCISDVPNT